MPKLAKLILHPELTVTVEVKGIELEDLYGRVFDEAEEIARGEILEEIREQGYDEDALDDWELEVQTDWNITKIKAEWQYIDATVEVTVLVNRQLD